jgi:hypothetical protein
MPGGKMLIRDAIIKMLSHYQPEEILRHMAHELEEQANHYKTAGRPMSASYLVKEVEALRECAKAIDRATSRERKY